MRNVRPSWVDLRVDGKLVKATGPKSRKGELVASFSARIDGDSVPLWEVQAIGSADGSTTVWRIVDRATGATIVERKVTQ